MKKYKRQIKSKGLKLSWIASRLGISASCLTMYLNENRNMPLHIETELIRLLKN